jgi:TetR/AcrR family fatty acid metabolism transcriptional regulator
LKDIIEKTVNKRERILMAAVEVFTRRGYNNARMEEIAETAGIGKGTLYEYFDSKMQLFNEMIIKSWEEYSNSLTADSIHELNFEESIREIIKGHFTFSKEKKKLARVLFWDTEIMDEELKEWMAGAVKNRKINRSDGKQSGGCRGDKAGRQDAGVHNTGGTGRIHLGHQHNGQLGNRSPGIS